GHNEYFKYMCDLLKGRGAEHANIFGGGGGVILAAQIDALEAYGIHSIYAQEHRREMGVHVMINELVQRADFPVGDSLNNEVDKIKDKNYPAIARLISSAENFPEVAKDSLDKTHEINKDVKIPVLGITGTGGAGKS